MAAQPDRDESRVPGLPGAVPADSDIHRGGSSAPPAPGAERSLLPSTTRMVLGLLLGLGVSVAVILLVDPGLKSQVLDAQRAAVQPAYLLVALGCVGVCMLTDAWSLLVLCRVFNPRLPRRPVVATALEAHLVGGATAFGGLELPYQVVMLRRASMTGYQATSVVILKGFVHTLLLAIVAVMALLPWVDSPMTTLQRRVVLGAMALLLLLWLAGWFWLRRPLGKSFLPQRLQAGVDQIQAAARALGVASTRQMLSLFGLQAVYWVAMFAVLIFVLHALGWRGSVVPIITGQAVMQVLMPLSPLPGGAGVAELTYMALIGPSAPASMVVASLVLWRVLTWAVPVSLGAMSIGIRSSRRVR